MYQRRFVLALLLLLVLFLGAPVWAGEAASFGPLVGPNGIHEEVEFGPSVDPKGIDGQLKSGPVSDPNGIRLGYGPILDLSGLQSRLSLGLVVGPSELDEEASKLEYGPIVDPHGVAVVEVSSAFDISMPLIWLHLDSNR